MKSLIAPALVAMSAAGFAAMPGHAAPAAQSTQIKPKPVATVPVSPDGTVGARPKLQTPADTAKAMTQADRTSIQSDLAWIGVYNGAINGDVSNRMIAAIKAFQKDQRHKETGVLNPQERNALTDAARKLQINVGWKYTHDPVTGARLGLPTKLVPQVTSTADGTKWSSTTGTIQISLERRKEAGATTATVAAREKKTAARKTDYTVVKPDFFVLSGLQGLKKFYVRGQTRANEVRVLTVLYDQATEGTMIPVVVAMSSAFDAFSDKGAVGPPPPRKVEYSTGIVVNADGAILADRAAVEGCASVVVNGHGNADRIAQDATSNLALLRIYGARDLHPLALGGGKTAEPDMMVTGIADPDHQGGHAAVTRIKAAATPVGDDIVLSPALDLGFSGAAVTDVDGIFAGMARLKPAIVAGPAAMPGQSSLVSANAVQEFLRAQKVEIASAASDPKASVLRIICVRK